MPSWYWQNIKQILSNTLRLNFGHPKINCILHPSYHLTITGHSLKHKQKSKHVCIGEFMQLTIIKMRKKMKIDSRKYDINRPRCNHRHNYSKYMKRLSMTMLICIKQHLSNICSSVYENVKQHWGWVEKKALLIKKACSQVRMPSIFGHAYTHAFYGGSFPGGREGRGGSNLPGAFFLEPFNDISMHF